MRKLTVNEIAAMWLYHKEYADKGCGAIKFHEELEQYEKNNIARMIKEIMEALKEGGV